MKRVFISAFLCMSIMSAICSNGKTDSLRMLFKEKLNVMYGFVQKGDELYKIVNTADWLFEGGFNVYILETFVGNSDVQTSFEDVDLGQNSYD